MPVRTIVIRTTQSGLIMRELNHLCSSNTKPRLAYAFLIQHCTLYTIPLCTSFRILPGRVGASRTTGTCCQLQTAGETNDILCKWFKTGVDTA